MKNKKKLIIATSIILGVLVLTLGLTYAAFTYNKTGETSKLVLGDIWMKYTENNQLTLADAMPMDINNKISYTVNPEMANQEIEYVSLDETNELTVCVSIFSYNLYGWFDPGSDAISYCQGTGTWDEGITFQDEVNYMSSTKLGEYLIENNVIILSDGNYIVNPEMSNQEVIETKEVNTLTKCYWQYLHLPFDEGSTAESYCKGTGTAFGGSTIREYVDDWVAEAEEYGGDFLEEGGQSLLDMEIVIQKIENLPYFEFTISGKNTYEKEDIWYEIVLTHGDNHETRTTRIRDNLLRFSLAKVEGDSETFLFNNRSYSDLNNKRIWVETINANTTSEVNNKYRLYMWISEDTVIGNVNQDYTLEEWNDVFASVKVGVNGDFKEKIVVTDGSCFTYISATTVNPIMKVQDASDETTELYKCINYVTTEGWRISWDWTAETFCRGTGGTVMGLTLQERFDIGLVPTYFVENNIALVSDEVFLNGYDDTCGSKVVIPRTVDGYDVVGIAAPASSWNGYGFIGGIFSSNVEEVVILDNINTIRTSAFARSSLKKVLIPNSVTEIGESAFSDNQLTNIEIPDSVTTIGSYAFSNNRLTSVEIPDSVTTIGDNAFYGNQLTSVEIPDSVTTIGYQAFSDNQLTSINIPNSVTMMDGNAFADNRLTSVIFEENSILTTIGGYAFSNNQLTSVEIPDSVTSIGWAAFENNQLKTVTIGSGISDLSGDVFKKSSTSNPNLESITFTSKTCEEIKAMRYFPWLYSSSPYYQSRYKADIIGTDGVCSY